MATINKRTGDKPMNYHHRFGGPSVYFFCCVSLGFDVQGALQRIVYDYTDTNSGDIAARMLTRIEQELAGPPTAWQVP